MDRAELADAVYAAAHLEGSFRLRSGRVSDEYFDKYRFESDPALLLAICEHLAPLVPPGAEVLAGIELGGVPLATMLSQVTGIPAAFVRKQAKEYGTARLAEGADVDGKAVVIIEDVVTSGGQVVMSTEELRAIGATCTVAVCVVDRQAGAVEALATADIELRPLFTMAELSGAATTRGHR